MPRNATYYDGDLRRDLMDAALDVIAADGPGAVSLRGLAKTVGVSHAAPANHFPDKQALFTALAREGFQRLGEEMSRAAAHSPGHRAAGGSPLGPLQDVGRAYISFAVRHRAYFDVMWREDLADHTDPELLAAGQQTLELLTRGVATIQESGWASDIDARTVAVTLWATAHGLAGLWLDGQLAMEFSDDLDQLAEQVLALLTRLGT